MPMPALLVPAARREGGGRDERRRPLAGRRPAAPPASSTATRRCSPAGCSVAHVGVRALNVVPVSLTATLTNAQAAVLHRHRASRSALHPQYRLLPGMPWPDPETGSRSGTAQLHAFARQVHERPGAGHQPYALRRLGRIGRRCRSSSSRAGSGWTPTTTTTPARSIGAKPGFLSGGGFPMRFADTDGSPIDVYQAEHEHRRRGRLRCTPRPSTRCSTTRSVPLGYYGTFGTNMHTDNPASAPGVGGDRSPRLWRAACRSSRQAVLDVGRTDATPRRSAPELERRHALRSSTDGRLPALTACRRFLPIQGPSGTLSALTRGGSPPSLHHPDDQGQSIALVRRPSPRIADGLVTHIDRTPVDAARAAQQHAGYVSALADAGWVIREVPPAEDMPDSAFIEDTMVVCDGLAVLSRARRRGAARRGARRRGGRPRARARGRADRGARHARRRRRAADRRHRLRRSRRAYERRRDPPAARPARRSRAHSGPGPAAVGAAPQVGGHRAPRRHADRRRP